MTNLNEADKALKKRNPLAALITSRELWRATEAGLAMIERACDPCELRRDSGHEGWSNGKTKTPVQGRSASPLC